MVYLDAFNRHLIKDWLETVPTDFVDSNQRRKRSASVPMAPETVQSHEDHPSKRQKQSTSNDGAPEQGTPEARIDRPTDLADQNESPKKIDSLPSHGQSGPLDPSADAESPLDSDQRTTPSRDTHTDMTTARPPVWVTPQAAFEGDIPTQVEELIDQLRAVVNERFIPKGFKGLMAGAGFKTSNMGTSSCDFDHGDTRTEEELSDMWQKVKTIYENASDCKLHTGDENAWSDDVVRPLLQLAIEIHGGDRWKLHNVKSQSIDPQYLSTIDAPTPANASRTRVVDRRADYALAYSHRSPRYSDLYVRLKAAKQSEVGPTLAQWTRQSAVFSGFEVKSPLGTQHEAEQQISIWIAASLRKKQELASIARVPPFQRADMVEPVFTIVGHHHFVYFAWPRKHPVSCEWGTQVLGPHSRLTFNTLDLHGVFQLLRFYGEVLKYAADEGPNGYWGRFFGKVLNQLAASRPDNN